MSAQASAKLTAAETKSKNRADLEIARRTSSLNDLLTRVSDIKNLSDSDKASISAAINAQLSSLATLKTKIDADTDSVTLKTDVQSITGSYRVYALLIPQVRIIAAADRIVTITREMQELGAKLQARITAAQTSGADVTAAITAFTDFNAQIADAQTNAQAAVTAVAALVPDQGDATKMAANTAALKAARAQIVAAQKDVRAAYADSQTIIKAVKGKPTVAATASTTASAGTAQ